MIWLPYPNFSLTAKVLSHEHLEQNAKNINHALGVLHQTLDAPMEPWIFEWQGYELQLAEFGMICLGELKYRKLNFPCTLGTSIHEHFVAAKSGSTLLPKWVSDVNRATDHKAKLLDEDFGYYQAFFGMVKPYSQRQS